MQLGFAFGTRRLEKKELWIDRSFERLSQKGSGWARAGAGVFRMSSRQVVLCYLGQQKEEFGASGSGLGQAPGAFPLLSPR